MIKNDKYKKTIVDFCCLQSSFFSIKALYKNKHMKFVREIIRQYKNIPFLNNAYKFKRKFV